jgi:D-alanyl-D-alanine carboxypeptidase (penicillin-binding protein 5/6)
MFIREGEFVRVDDLIKGVAVVSGNDACIALAEGISGVTEVFVESMNKKAQALGLENTNFTDVHGLDNTGAQYTTAKDVANLSKAYITDHPEALDYHSTLEFSFNGITQRNRNGLLWTYPGVDGLKTGHLNAVGYNLVATAKESDMRLIAVVLGASSEAIRETEVRKLLNYGFRNFETVRASELVEPISTTVYKGKVGKVDVVPATDSSMIVPLGAKDRIRVVRELDSSITAPVKKGESVGQFRFYWQDELLGSTDATVAENVEKGGFFKVLWDSIRLFFVNLFSKITNK